MLPKSVTTPFVAFVLISLLVSAFAFPASSGAVKDAQQAEYIPGELIVGVDVRQVKSSADIASVAASVGVVIEEVSVNRDAYLLGFKSDEQATEAIDALRAAPGVLYVERNGIMRIPPLDSLEAKTGSENLPTIEAYNPNDELRSYQWHLDKILYQLTAEPEYDPPCIVVLDTGVDYTHADLHDKVIKGRDFFDNDNDPMDANGHGTHVAGIAAGMTNNIIGISGVSPRSNILAVRVLGPSGWGTWWMVAQGIEWANSRTSTACGGQDPRIYNLSLGGDDYSAIVSTAIAGAYAKGRLVTAAAGNSNSSAYIYPGSDPKAFGVAATEENDRRTFFSNYDTAADRWVDIAAPGWNILSTVPGGYAYYSGTSMAAPVVAGLAARVWAKYPTYTLAQLRTRIQATADSTGGFPRTIRRVNLYRALGGTGRTLQGQVFDAANVAPLAGASVIVSQGGTTFCTTWTKKSGFYTCPSLPAAGRYLIEVSKSGHPTVKQSWSVGARRFNANLAMSRNLGSSKANNWTTTIMWTGWQPYESKGLEFDIWLVDPGSVPTCYSTWSNPIDDDPWNILLPVDSWARGQTEAAWIKKAYGGTLQVWVTLWDGAYNTWPDTARITGSRLLFRVYKNNKQVAALRAPNSPTTNTADNWFVGTINLDTNKWTSANQIKTDGQLPSCVMVP